MKRAFKFYPEKCWKYFSITSRKLNWTWITWITVLRSHTGTVTVEAQAPLRPTQGQGTQPRERVRTSLWDIKWEQILLLTNRSFLDLLPHLRKAKQLCLHPTYNLQSASRVRVWLNSWMEWYSLLWLHRRFLSYKLTAPTYNKFCDIGVYY